MEMHPYKETPVMKADVKIEPGKAGWEEWTPPLCHAGGAMERKSIENRKVRGFDSIPA